MVRTTRRIHPFFSLDSPNAEVETLTVAHLGSPKLTLSLTLEGHQKYFPSHHRETSPSYRFDVASHGSHPEGLLDGAPERRRFRAP